MVGQIIIIKKIIHMYVAYLNTCFLQSFISLKYTKPTPMNLVDVWLVVCGPNVCFISYIVWLTMQLTVLSGCLGKSEKLNPFHYSSSLDALTGAIFLFCQWILIICIFPHSTVFLLILSFGHFTNSLILSQNV